MRKIIEEVYVALYLCIVIISWLAGVVLASGWLKFLSAIFPPYAWYLVVEKIMKLTGIV